MLHIQKVCPKDQDIWLSFRQSLWPHSSRDELLREIELILQGQVATIADPDYGSVTLLKEEAFLAMENATPVGFLELSIRKEAPGTDGQPVAFVEAWWVAPEFRARGYGKALMDFAESWARKEGFSRLASDTTSEYTGSREAHLKLGFKEVKSIHHFLRKI